MMERPAGTDGPYRGVKRKTSDAQDARKLTPSQRLAAARRAGVDTTVDVPPSKTSRCGPGDGGDGSTAAGGARKDDAHYESLYASDPDFRALGKEDAEFGTFLAKGAHLDFTDPAAVMQLTKTLLKRDFDLRIELPDDRLCPPVPNRHNYILWLKTLLDSTSESFTENYEPSRRVTGLDVGTGASAIYPLLGCAQRPSWSFVATEMDAKSLAYAKKNMELNGSVASRIRLVERSPEACLIPLDELGLERIDFVMTNPPFYTSASELEELARRKSRPPSSACTGAANEMVCDGGEVGFMRRIVEESLALRGRVQWYTSMVGKQSSLEAVVELLRGHGVENYAVTQFVQGTKTRRWAVGWSFGRRRPCARACRGFEPAAGKKLLPPPTESTAAAKAVPEAKAEQAANTFWTQLENVTEGLDLVSWHLDEERLRGVGFADANVWSRTYRRRKGRETAAALAQDGAQATAAAKAVAGPGPGEKDVAACALGFSITIQTLRGEGGRGQARVVAVVRWLQGSDYGLFESFCGMVRNAFAVL